MNRSTIIALLTLVLCVALGFGVSQYRFGGAESQLPAAAAVETAEDDGYTVCVSGSAQIAVSELEELDISWPSGSVSVSCHDGDYIQISESSPAGLSEKQRMRYELDGDTLRIRAVRQSASTPSKELTLLLPRALYFDELKIDTESADVSLDGLDTMSAVIVDSASGAITAEGLGDVYVGAQSVSGNIDVTTADSKGPMLLSVSGRIYLSSTSKTAVTAVVESVSGETEAHFAAAPQRFHAESVSGTVLVYLPEDSVFTAGFDTKSGSFDCDFPQKDHVYGMGAGDWGALGTPEADCVIEAETVSGSMHIYAGGPERSK